MATQFEVQTTVKLDDADLVIIENKEALFFYHIWMRSEFELIRLAHDILLGLSDAGMKANYQETAEYKTVESLIRQSPDNRKKIRLNCPFTGQFQWVDSELMLEIYDDLIWDLSDHITHAYGIEDYFCGFYDGDWGLWPSRDGSIGQ